MSEDSDQDTDLIRTFIPQLRDALYLETGVRFPGVRVRPHQRGMAESSFVIRIADVPTSKETLPEGMCLAIATPQRVAKLGVDSKPIMHPVSKAKIALVADEDSPVLEASGVSVWRDGGIVALYLASVLRSKAARVHQHPGGLRADRPPGEGLPRAGEGGRAEGCDGPAAPSGSSAGSSTRACRSET